MKNIIPIASIVLSIIITSLILLQGKGAGLGSAWGGGGETFHTRRGLEKWTLRVTIILVAMFLILSLVNLLV